MTLWNTFKTIVNNFTNYTASYYNYFKVVAVVCTKVEQANTFYRVTVSEAFFLVRTR